MSKREVLAEMEKDNAQNVYICPMHPEVVRDISGICPECSMNLLPVKDFKKLSHKEYDRHAGHSSAIFLKKFWVSLLLTVPVVVYSDVFQKIVQQQPPVFPGSEYVPLVFSSLVFFYGGWVFIVGAWRELNARLPGMMTLIGIATSVAYLYSVYAVFSRQGDALFLELTTLITVMLLGHWMEMRAVSSAQGALKELSKLLPDTAEVMRDGKIETISLHELRKGDIVNVRPGGRISADGTVVEGNSEVDESMMTGESAPMPKAVRSEVIAGTVNGDGSLKVRVTKIGEKTFLAGVMRLVAEAQASKSRIQILSDRAAYYLTLIAISAGGLTFAFWTAAQAGFGFALERLVAVLVIACPHALGLAVPLVASISTTLAARNGFLVRRRLALEAARNIDVVLFDKTGTLTKGEYGVTNVWTLAAQSEKELLGFAAAVDARSEHFISKAIVKKAEEIGAEKMESGDFLRMPGKGVRGVVGGKIIFVGGESMLTDLRFGVPEKNKKEIEAEHRKGKTIVYVAGEKELLGIIALADLVREESREAVRRLGAMGIKVAMITGDSEEVAAWVAKELGIREYFSRVLPHQKSEKVKMLQAKGDIVAMVGDGVNDAPALAVSDIGIAIGAGTNVAIESAGIILFRNDPRDIAKIITLSHITYAKMVQNLFWAAGYNVIAIPLAAGALAFRGITLQPALSAFLMSMSTVIVAVNAILMRRKSL